MKPGSNKLDTEDQIAAALQVSRDTVRRAIAGLRDEGLITRRQGSGNYTHPAVLDLDMRIDLYSDFRLLLSKAGYRVSIVQSDPVAAPPSPQMVSRIPQSKGTDVYLLEWTYYANERPAIYCRNEVPQELFSKNPAYGSDEITLSRYLKVHCDVETAHTAAWLKATLDTGASHLFGIEEGTPLLAWDELFYDILDRIVCFVEIFFHPEIVNMSLLKKV